jgi:hypothetical protein
MGMDNKISDAICTLYDIKYVLKKHNLLNEPRLDDLGMEDEITVGDILDDTLELLEDLENLILSDRFTYKGEDNE